MANLISWGGHKRRGGARAALMARLQQVHAHTATPILCLPTSTAQHPLHRRRLRESNPLPPPTTTPCNLPSRPPSPSPSTPTQQLIRQCAHAFRAHISVSARLSPPIHFFACVCTYAACFFFLLFFFCIWVQSCMQQRLDELCIRGR